MWEFVNITESNWEYSKELILKNLLIFSQEEFEMSHGNPIYKLKYDDDDIDRIGGYTGKEEAEKIMDAFCIKAVGMNWKRTLSEYGKEGYDQPLTRPVYKDMFRKLWNTPYCRKNSRLIPVFMFAYFSIKVFPLHYHPIGPERLTFSFLMDDDHYHSSWLYSIIDYFKKHTDKTVFLGVE